MIEARGIGYRYANRQALEGVSAKFGRGELVGIAGPNGAGKSTLLKIMANVLTPHQGEVLLDELPLSRWKAREYARRVGYLPQEPEPTFPMRALDVVVSGRGAFLGRFEWESPADYERARQALALSDAGYLAERLIDEMSGGERKRVFLARVLAADPDVILLDEPLSQLDLAHTAGFTRLLREIVDRSGRTVIFVTHDLNWSAAYADRMIILSSGRIAADGPPADVLRPELLTAHFGLDSGMLQPVEEGRRWWAVPSGSRTNRELGIEN